MSDFQQTWLRVWCMGVAIFGLVLAGGAFEATQGPTMFLMTFMHSSTPEVYDETLRFAIGLMGAVTFGWALTTYQVFEAAHALGDRAGPIWRGVTLAWGLWFVIDGTISVATGFALNAVSNTVIMALYLVPVLGAGVLGRAGQDGHGRLV